MGEHDIYLITFAATWRDNDIDHRVRERFVVNVTDADREGNELLMNAALRKVNKRIAERDAEMEKYGAEQHDKWEGYEFESIELMADTTIL